MTSRGQQATRAEQHLGQPAEPAEPGFPHSIRRASGPCPYCVFIDCFPASNMMSLIHMKLSSECDVLFPTPPQLAVTELINNKAAVCGQWSKSPKPVDGLFSATPGSENTIMVMTFVFIPIPQCLHESFRQLTTLEPHKLMKML